MNITSNEKIQEIKYLYTNTKKTQLEIAKITGVGRVSVNKYCKGLRKYIKNRGVRGDSNVRHKLKNDDTVQIVIRLLRGEKQLKLAKEFNVTQSVISRISNGKAWKYLFQEEPLKTEILKIKTTLKKL